jgi:hypothetical protein
LIDGVPCLVVAVGPQMTVSVERLHRLLVPETLLNGLD